jgi:predicted transcriptional regulator
MERIADVLRLKIPQFNTIGPERNIMDALHQMRCEHVDYLIIMDDDERFIGILTDHDIAEKVFRFKDLEKATVRDFMNTNLPVSNADDSLEYCMQLMERYNVSYLVVYDQFEFMGVVSMNDLMKQALSMRKDTFTERADELYAWSY